MCCRLLVAPFVPALVSASLLNFEKLFIEDGWTNWDDIHEWYVILLSSNQILEMSMEAETKPNKQGKDFALTNDKIRIPADILFISIF
jgi:hypothetical protein